MGRSRPDVRKVRDRNYHKRAGRTCSECSTPITDKNVHGRCQSCRMRGAHNPSWKGGGPRIQSNGYVLISGVSHPNARNGSIYEHTLVMATLLGRALAKDEEVHHKNNIRHDNDPSNLELWTRSQPPGARVSDMIEWCERFLARYRETTTTQATR